MSKTNYLGHSKFTVGEANCQPMLATEEKNLVEIVDMGGEIPAEINISSRKQNRRVDHLHRT